ncbi:palmitoyl-(protein) hydrolase [Aureococcus anophagefferens]|nr:palmitoyl-(protein) hydrolase [Aureococcus anophagefferens]
MGLVNSVGSRAMRPPNPPSYGLEADGDGWRFTSPPLDYGCAAWSPQNNYANGCPIGFPARARRGRRTSRTP